MQSQTSSTASHQATDRKLLDAIAVGERLHVVFEDVRAWVPVAPAGPSFMQRLESWACTPKHDDDEAVRKQILFSISASCAPGQLLALMGPSGKTSLLSILGARAPKTMTFSGTVLFNGTPMSNRIRRRLGFVFQDDLLHEALTVYETLRYIALLCLPRSMSIEEKDAHAQRVMSVLGIDRQRDTLVGGRMHKGVSGGERKRVSVGAELLMNPSVLLLDEPTSGLDAATALQLVETLRQLALGGRTIITTIHQPSSRLYASMDSLLLLSCGHVMYFGKASLADRWFAHLGYPNPGNSSIADYVLDLASNTVPLPSAKQGRLSSVSTCEGDTIQYLTTTAEAFLQQHPRHGFVDPQQLQECTQGDCLQLPVPSKLLPTTSGAYVRPKNEQDGAVTSSSLDRRSRESESRFGASWGLQVRVLLERSVRARRLETVNVETCMQTLLLGLLAGCFFFQSGQGSTIDDLRDFGGVIFFLPQFPTLRTMVVAVFTFPAEYAMLRKERASGMYQLSAYYLARSVADLPLIMMLPTIFFNEIYWLAGFSRNAADYFFSYFTLFLMVITSHSAGLCIGAWLMDAKRAQVTVMVFAWFQLMVGGFLVRSMPAWIDWSKYTAFYYWGFSLLNHIQLAAIHVTGCVDDKGVSRRCSPHDLSVRFHLPHLSHNKALDIAVIVLSLVVFRLCTYFALKRSISS